MVDILKNNQNIIMKKNILVGVVVVFVIAFVFFGLQKLTEVKYEATPETPKIENKITDELQRIIDEENFKKATILRARVVANDRKKAEEIARNKKAIEVIESEYEAIRQAELLLVGSSTPTETSSLK